MPARRKRDETRSSYETHAQILDQDRRPCRCRCGRSAHSCAKPSKVSGPWAPVSIYRAATYSEELYDLVRRIIADHALDVRGKRVVLKPNLVEFDAHTVINTNPKLVHAAYEAFRAAGAADVRIAEGPGHRRVTLDLADAGGYFATVPKFEDVFTDLNLDEITRVALSAPAIPAGVAVPSQHCSRVRPPGVHAQAQNPSLGRRHAKYEESLRCRPRRRLRLA